MLEALSGLMLTRMWVEVIVLACLAWLVDLTALPMTNDFYIVATIVVKSSKRDKSCI